MTYGLFIDAAYVHREFIRAHGRVDYPKLREALSNRLGAEPVASHFFNAVDDNESERTGNLHRALEKWHFTVHLGWIQSRPLFWDDGTPVVHPFTGASYLLKNQKGVDVSLAHHLIKSHTALRWAKLALVAGDADFEEPVAELVRERGVELFLVGPENTISTRLQALAAEVLLLDHEPLRSVARGIFRPSE